MKITYSSFRYDDHLVLKVSPLLRLAIIYGMRHVFMVFIAFFPSTKTADSYTYLQDQVTPIMIMGDLLVMIVAFAWSRRSSDSKPIFKSLWHKGKWLLLAGYALDLVILLVGQGGAILNFTINVTWILLQIALDICFLAYLAKSQLVRDVFEDYPRPAEVKIPKFSSIRQPPKSME